MDVDDGMSAVGRRSLPDDPVGALGDVVGGGTAAVGVAVGFTGVGGEVIPLGTYCVGDCDMGGWTGEVGIQYMVGTGVGLVGIQFQAGFQLGGKEGAFVSPLLVGWKVGARVGAPDCPTKVG
jgi:hypothetical protein